MNFTVTVNTVVPRVEKATDSKTAANDTKKQQEAADDRLDAGAFLEPATDERNQAAFSPNPGSKVKSPDLEGNKSYDLVLDLLTHLDNMTLTLGLKQALDDLREARGEDELTEVGLRVRYEVNISLGKFLIFKTKINSCVPSRVNQALVALLD